MELVPGLSLAFDRSSRRMIRLVRDARLIAAQAYPGRSLSR